jgi:predicted component of type VI protein secretion system
MASVIVVGRSKRRAHALEDAVTVVGRDSGANLELGDLQISRRHALLIRASQGFFVKDLGSRNGVLLNEVRVPTRQQACLQDGDVLTLGRTTLIFKEIVEAADLVVPITEPVSEPAPASEPAAEADPSKTPVSLPPAKLRSRPPGSPSARTPLTVDPVELQPTPQSRAPQPKTPSHPEPTHRTPTSVPATPPRRAPSSSHNRKPSAEALTLHALIERTERDRQFFRNVSMVLFCFLLVTLILVFAWALFQRNATPPAQPQPAQKPAAAAPAQPEIALDPAAFTRDVQPLLASKCASCHSQPDRGGTLRLASAQDAATTAGNLAAVAAFVTPGDLAKSPLLLKPLAVAEGGIMHGGGDVLTVEDPEWIALREWVTQARSGAQTPLARILAPRQAALGHPVAFNAEAQAARGGALAFRWTLLETPADSRADLREVSGSRTRLTPDVAGRYVVELQVREGSAVASSTHAVEVGAAGKDAPPPPGAPKASPEDTKKPAEPRIEGSDLSAIFRRCLGREPSQEEQRRFATAGPDALKRFLLGEDALYARWWGQELDHLGLVGQHAPRDEPWTSLPRQLRQGRFSVADVHYALLVGQFWSERYPEPQASAKAMVEKILGPSASDDTKLLKEAMSLLEGHEVTFLGNKVSGQVGLVRSLVRSKRAAATLLQRTHFRLRGRNLTKPELAAALEAYQADPRSYFSSYLEWATSE